MTNEINETIVTVKELRSKAFGVSEELYTYLGRAMADLIRARDEAQKGESK